MRGPETNILINLLHILDITLPIHMVDYTVMDAHDKQLLMKVAEIVEDNQRRLTLIEELLRSSKTTATAEAQDKEAKRAAKQLAIDALSASDRELFDALRHWRRAVAGESGRSPMTVCHDQALLDIVAWRPKDEIGLRAVNGNLATKFGPQLLSIIKRHPSDQGDQPW